MTERSLSARIAAFGVVPLLGFVSPILALPVIARHATPSEWAGLLSAQALGGFAGVLILSGWAVVGEAAVARLRGDTESRRQVYSNSVRSRTLNGLVILPVLLLVTQMIAGGDAVANALMALSAAASGYSLTWYAVGTGAAGLILRFELGPRLLGTLVSIPAVIVFDRIWLYPVLVFAFWAGAVMVFHVREMGSLWPLRRFPDVDPGHRRSGAVLTLVGAAYSSSPLPIGSALNLQGLAHLASADRLYRYALYSVTSLAGALQEWVVGAPHEVGRARLGTAIKLHVLLGAVGGAALALFGPTAGSLLFGARIAPGYVLTACAGIAFFAVSISTSLVRHLLVPGGMARVVVRTTLVSAIIGLSSIVALGGHFGTRGVSVGLAIAEVTNLLLLMPSALGMARSRMLLLEGTTRAV